MRSARRTPRLRCLSPEELFVFLDELEAEAAGTEKTVRGYRVKVKYKPVAEIVAVLRQVEAGARVAEICRKVGISEATYYLWKRQYSGVGLSELRELRQLREENGRLKRLVADLSMDRQILQEIVSKKL
jgi:putative transposase